MWRVLSLSIPMDVGPIHQKYIFLYTKRFQSVLYKNIYLINILCASIVNDLKILKDQNININLDTKITK